MEPTNQGNPYAAPASEFNAAPQPVGGAASLENAVAGRYDFEIGDVMSEAWQLTKGFKGSFWAAGIVVFLMLIVAQTVGGFLFKSSGTIPKMIFNGFIGALMTPLTVGIQMMSVRRALGQPYSFSTAFEYLPKAGTLIVVGLLTVLATYLGFILLVIPGIYVSIGYMMAKPLVAAENLTAWKAMEISRKATHHRWFGVFGLFFVVGLLTTISALGLLIPLIWTVPWAVMTSGVLYKRMFHSAAAASQASAPPSAA